MKLPSTSSALSPKCDSPKNPKNESTFELHGLAGDLTLPRMVGAGFFQMTVKKVRKAFSMEISRYLLDS